MDKYIILADVTCDLSKEIRDYFKIEDYIEGFATFSDGRDIKTTLDWSNISREDFYKTLSGKTTVKTAPPSPEAYYQTFKDYVLKGYKVLSMSLSSKISSTFGVAVGAANRVKEEISEANIYCFDTLRMSGAFGLLVMHAHQMKNDGASFEEVIAWLEENKTRVHQMGPIDDLIFVARRGQITMGKAIMGNFAGVKPMGDCSEDGYVSVLAKVKGINRALEITASYLEAVATDLEEQFVLISHSNREAFAFKLKEIIEAKLKVKAVFISDVFSGCGANIGPGMIGVYFLGDKVSKEMQKEKEIIAEIINR